MIPVLSDDAGELADNCFVLTQPGQADDSLPSLKKARLTVKNMAGIPYLALTTQYAVNDPVLVFAIETRCSGLVRREYTLLLDVASNASNAAVVVSPVIVPPVVARPRVAQPAPKTDAELFSSKQGLVAKRKLPASDRHPAAVARPAVIQPAFAVNLHLSTSLSSLPGQYPLSAEQLIALKRMRGMLSIDAGRPASEIDRLRDDLVASQQQLAQAKHALVLLRAQTVKPAQPQPALQPTAARNAAASWRRSGWLWIGLALLVLVAGYVLDRRRKLSNLMFTVPSPDDQADKGQIKLGAIAQVDSATNDLWAHVDDVAAPSSQQHPDIEFAVDKLPGHDLLARPAERHNTVQSEALSVSSLMRVTEEAEVFLGLGYKDRAIAVLSEDIAGHPRNHPAVWFMLLGIYRELGDHESFDRTVAGFKQRFNLIVPTWNLIMPAEQKGEGVLAMTHIMTRIISLWPDHECYDYLSELLYDDRQGSRQGFSLDVYRDIIWLKEVLDILSKPETKIAEEVAAEDNLDWDFQ
ncbi:hypothetical protein CAP31_02450 [Sulfuriferula sp. AH1]|uniref:type IV pilus assembly protein FimV n=1 Tax=Sulfuriferula sp. AH1 TaxID=1985873 RepID=UPI000B3B73E4|nr:hypothetical protein [Sulfuriferula sp. AH1]ARU30648.1 hypothetical protein CAP31_02450 [Sulfuriferula sp. AH1]